MDAFVSVPTKPTAWRAAIVGARMKLPLTFSTELPPAAIAALRKLPPGDAYPDIEPLLVAVDYPRDPVGPRADALTPAQRAMVELITELDLQTSNNDIDMWMPRTRADRRSWLGLDQPQPLDREYAFVLAGQPRTEPGWRALKLLSDAEDEAGEGLVDAWLATVPVAERLAMFGQVNLTNSEPWGLNENDFFDPDDDKLVAGLRDEGKTWAPAYADQWLAVRAAGGGRKSPPLWPMLAMLCVGVWSGGGWLAGENAQAARVGLGLCVAAYAGLSLAAVRFHVTPRMERWLGAPVGLASGLVTAATGVVVMPTVPYLQSLGLAKEDLIQALGLSFLVGTVALGFGLANDGVYDSANLIGSAFALLPALGGMWIGTILRHRLPAEGFRRWFLIGLLALGVYLVLRGLT